ncbi:MAG: carboxypeptidase-like regulatory domain-containing protein [Bacteroidales bacterium]|nr:carboxypeptidase-like regulatory domain-containing protein [Bacteroidales bacterium]
MKNIILTIFMVFVAAQLFAQSKMVSGTVKDKNGLPIAGATVQEKGVTNSTLTDADGNFSIEVRMGTKIIIKMKGYKTQEVSVDDANGLSNIILEKALKRLEYGIQAGVNLAEDYYGKKLEEYEKTDQMAMGYTAGLYMDINLSRFFSFETGLHYRLMSLKEENSKYKARADFHFASIPLYFKHSIRIKDDRLYLFYGADFNLCWKRQLKEEYDGKTDEIGDQFSMMLTYPGVILIPGLGYERKNKLGIRANVYYWTPDTYYEPGDLMAYFVTLTYKF